MRRAELAYEIAQLKSKLESLNDALSELNFKINNPPEYKYGDVVSIDIKRDVISSITTTVEMKILDCKIRRDSFRMINVVKYLWLYTVDVVGIGMKELTEYQIHELKQGKMKFHEI